MNALKVCSHRKFAPVLYIQTTNLRYICNYKEFVLLLTFTEKVKKVRNLIIICNVSIKWNVIQDATAPLFWIACYVALSTHLSIWFEPGPVANWVRRWNRTNTSSAKIFSMESYKWYSLKFLDNALCEIFPSFVFGAHSMNLTNDWIRHNLFSFRCICHLQMYATAKSCPFKLVVPLNFKGTNITFLVEVPQVKFLEIPCFIRTGTDVCWFVRQTIASKLTRLISYYLYNRTRYKSCALSPRISF